MQTIEFKLTSWEYACFANFYRKAFIVDDIKWKTSEHLYQYKKMKFLKDIGEPITEDHLNAIIDAKSPTIAKQLGHIKCKNIDKWDEVKVDAMMDILREKFKYEKFRNKLLSTGDATIIEASYYDTFWSYNTKKKIGLNKMGECLMRLRDELRNE